MAEKNQRQDEKAGKQEDEHRALPAAEVAADRDAYQNRGRDRDDDHGMQAEVLAGEADAHELRADGQKVQKEYARDRVHSPEPAEALADEPRVADAGHRAQPDDHLLVDDQNRNQQDQRPEQRVAEVLAGLGVRGDAAGVVVADHDDEPRTDDRGEREEAAPPGPARRDVADADGAERALDVALVQLVEKG